VTPEVAKKTVRQHIAIVAAIERSDEEAAGEAMREHLDFVLRYSATR
jgi:DNA-binding FadR family transcriptional regulator